MLEEDMHFGKKKKSRIGGIKRAGGRTVYSIKYSCQSRPR